MVQRPTVLLLIPHLGGGGAERVTALLARGLSPHKYGVHLALVTQSAPPVNCLPASVTVHTLGSPRVRAAAVPLVRLVQRLQPDVILSGMAHLNFLVLLAKPFFPRKTQVFVRQNATVSASLDSGQLPSYTSFLYRVLYPSADRIICQSRAMAVDLARQTHVRPSKIWVLPNPVDTAGIQAGSGSGAGLWKGPGPHLLAIGRLAPEKGFDLLLKAFSSVRICFPSADLTILGSGPDETALKSLCRTLRLESLVNFPGYCPHPESYFPAATLFVLSSRHEGLPNALLEAAAAGLPIVALPSSPGVCDLLCGKPGVWLAGDVSARSLTQSLLAALQSIPCGQRFDHTWIELFRMDRALQRYECLIDETLAGGRK